MKILSKTPLVLITALAAMAESAYGQQPPDVVNSDGYQNTAMGTDALLSLTPNSPPGYGSGNTASGYGALFSNTSGAANTASGEIALFSNTTGNSNTASGVSALVSNTSGAANTASGASALGSNTTGILNTASGDSTLNQNTTGNSNTASGVSALGSNTTGSNNIAEGYEAGYNLTTGSNNIDIGSPGVAGESDAIHIGTRGTQKATFIAGIYGTPVTGNAVMINSNGRLGVVGSSERYKTAITPMGFNSAKLGQLRPVTFHLKTDPNGALQYGLIAEQVAKVYPELVIRDEKGRIDGVRYDELAPMLLNEVQQQKNKISAMEQRLAQMQVALLNLETKEELLARH